MSPWARWHSRPLCVSSRWHGGFPWKRTESPLQMYYYCRGANTWLFCIRDVTLHLIGASLGHSHTTHIVVPIHRNSLLPEPFFTFTWFYFSFYYKHSHRLRNIIWRYKGFSFWDDSSLYFDVSSFGFSDFSEKEFELLDNFMGSIVPQNNQMG